MLIGVPREIKKQENRVGLTPGSVRELVHHGHRVLVERDAGAAIGFSDADYRAAGAKIAKDAARVFATADMIVKVKEPQPAEIRMLRPGQVLFTYLHLAPDRRQTRGLIKSNCVAIAYETVTGPGGRGLPSSSTPARRAKCCRPRRATAKATSFLRWSGSKPVAARTEAKASAWPTTRPATTSLPAA